MSLQDLLDTLFRRNQYPVEHQVNYEANSKSDLKVYSPALSANNRPFPFGRLSYVFEKKRRG